ncbi:hypothetical protein PR202_gb02304 [Eleusine coracana subsp. coracana]|uniref:Peptidase M41 domain-containing protein n=1 Tax=Eleusine coracana subsp. coracana TaxID=191504 RepID=A0AAV5DXX4_ELECO|nr:hypothetical protein PR202_gb02304 [Eleusine coracana subsp. coracana]
MVTRYGMSERVGLVSYNYNDSGNTMSTETRGLIEQEVKEILERAYNNAKTILTTHDKELHALAKALLENETLSGAQIKNLLAQVNKSNTMQQETVKVSQETPTVPASPQSTAAAKAKGVAGTAVAAQEAAAKAKGVAGIGS